MIATITYNRNTQKSTDGFRSLLTQDILTDICVRLTGQRNYIVVELTVGYNKGRLLTLEYGNMTHFVTLSEQKASGRNSSLQSVATAINIYYSRPVANKALWYYFVPFQGNLFTDYHLLYYKLLSTAGMGFLNIPEEYRDVIEPYRTVDDIILDRGKTKRSNRSNNSSFVSKTQDRIQLYAKTYGANKYESTVFGVALSKIADRHIDVFVVSEQDLKTLPMPSLCTFERLGNISVYPTPLRLNRKVSDTEEAKKLRSAAYNYNLLDRIGMKKCMLCGCEIPEIIHGAHIWGVADIRKCDMMDNSQKYAHAVSGHNGLWLCHNHHKLFDSNFLAFDTAGRCLVKNSIPRIYDSYIHQSIATPSLATSILSSEFRSYLCRRNQSIDLNAYTVV